MSQQLSIIRMRWDLLMEGATANHIKLIINGMTQNLVDELFAQITRLERENERLQAAVAQFDH